MIFISFLIILTHCSTITGNGSSRFQTSSYSFHGHLFSSSDLIDKSGKWGFRTSVSPENQQRKKFNKKVKEVQTVQTIQTIQPVSSVKRLEIVNAARRLIGIKDSFNTNNTNPMIFHILKVNNIDYKINDVNQLFAKIQSKGIFYREGKPSAGDLVFLSTMLSPKDKKDPDLYSDVGIVEKVTETGTVTFIIYIDGVVQRMNLNLSLPEVMKDENTGEIKNSIVKKTILISKFFKGFGRIVED